MIKLVLAIGLILMGLLADIKPVSVLDTRCALASPVLFSEPYHKTRLLLTISAKYVSVFYPRDNIKLILISQFDDHWDTVGTYFNIYRKVTLQERVQHYVRPGISPLDYLFVIIKWYIGDKVGYFDRSAKGWSGPVVLNFKRSATVGDGVVCWRSENIYSEISSLLSASRLTSLPQSPNEQASANEANPERPASVLGRVRSAVRRLPLGAQVGIASILALFASPILFNGFCRLSDGGGYRISGALYFSGGLGVLGLSALFWWLASPY